MYTKIITDQSIPIYNIQLVIKKMFGRNRI